MGLKVEKKGVKWWPRLNRERGEAKRCFLAPMNQSLMKRAD